MPTYLTNLGESSLKYSPSLTCLQIYQHVEGCPICHQIFKVKTPKNVTVPNFRGAGDSITISSSTVLIFIMLVVVLLVYAIKKFCGNS